MKRIVLILAGVGLAVLFVGMFAYRVNAARERNAETTEVAAAPSVKVAKAEKRTVPQTVRITGALRAQNEVQVQAKMPGKITKVLVEVGAVVKAGEVLALQENTELLLRMRQAEAQLQGARAMVEQAKVQAQLATSAGERAGSLRKQGALSAVELENAEAQKKLADVAVQSAEAQVALADASLGLAQQAYNDSRITTPVAGVVARRAVDVGTNANPGVPLFIVQDQTNLKMLGTVASHEVTRLKAGLKVMVSVEELPDLELEGTLSRVAPTLQQETRRAEVEVALPPTEGLLPYMFGTAEIAFGEREGAMVVPSTAVLSSASGPRLYVVENGVARLKEPKVGARLGDSIIIEEGLSEGDQVVVSGDAGLSDGIAVQVATPGNG